MVFFCFIGEAQQTPSNEQMVLSVLASVAVSGDGPFV
jgi:hypothetical protein